MSVQSFGSFEEMQAYMAQKGQEAKERIQEHQTALADGKKHYFLRLVAYGPEVLLIVGYTHDIDEHAAAMHAKYVVDEESQQEHDWELANMRARLQDGFVFTRSYSIAEPEGELGDAHIATMLEIPQEVFEACREAGFDLGVIWPDQLHPARPYIARWARAVAFQ